jgi:hypothetical protein
VLLLLLLLLPLVVLLLQLMVLPLPLLSCCWHCELSEANAHNLPYFASTSLKGCCCCCCCSGAAAATGGAAAAADGAATAVLRYFCELMVLPLQLMVLPLPLLSCCWHCERATLTSELELKSCVHYLVCNGAACFMLLSP